MQTMAFSTWSDYYVQGQVKLDVLAADNAEQET